MPDQTNILEQTWADTIAADAKVANKAFYEKVRGHSGLGDYNLVASWLRDKRRAVQAAERGDIAIPADIVDDLQPLWQKAVVTAMAELEARHAAALDRLAKAVKEGVFEAGGFPMEFGTITVSDVISMGCSSTRSAPRFAFATARPATFRTRMWMPKFAAVYSRFFKNWNQDFSACTRSCAFGSEDLISRSAYNSTRLPVRKVNACCSPVTRPCWHACRAAPGSAARPP